MPLVNPVSVSSAEVPVYIGPTETFNVPQFKQMLWEHVIDCEGVLDIDGVLVDASTKLT